MARIGPEGVDKASRPGGIRAPHGRPPSSVAHSNIVRHFYDDFFLVQFHYFVLVQFHYFLLVQFHYFLLDASCPRRRRYKL